MIPKFVLSASVAGLLLASVSARPLPQQTPPQQSEPKQQTESKSASGKVTDIAKDKRSFSVQPSSNQDNSGSKGAIVFIINGDTQIKGQVTVGTDVDVQYRPTPDGNLAMVISPRSGGGGSQ